MRSALLRWGLLAAAGGLAVALFAGLHVRQSVASWRQKHERVRELQTENADLKKEIERRRQRIRELEQSRARQELETRQQRKMLRENEKSVVTPGQESQEPSTR